MELLVVRHAIAEDRERYARSGGAPDSNRPLTPRGRQRMRSAARGLTRIMDGIDLLITSPYSRARETADILARAFTPRSPEPMLSDLLVPDAEEDALYQWLIREHPIRRIALVGHEPHVSRFVTWLLTGRTTDSIFRFKKGAIASLDIDPGLPAGYAVLRWYLTPRQLRSLDTQ